MNLGENIKRARERAGITQIALAERLNVNQMAISRWENNNRTPNAITFGEICRAIGASADEILELRER
ncbi:MAG: helix-turn-helix domain-containing protein [bacterium]|nr:helix-turn-helix domain-containing protein [bacterium]